VVEKALSKSWINVLAGKVGSSDTVTDTNILYWLSAKFGSQMLGPLLL